MPNWVTRTIHGALACAFCGGAVVYLSQSWICTKMRCETHLDEPVQQSQGFGGWGQNTGNLVYSGTASGTSQYINSTGTTIS